MVMERRKSVRMIFSAQSESRTRNPYSTRSRVLNTKLTTERIAASWRSSRQPPTRSAPSSRGTSRAKSATSNCPSASVNAVYSRRVARRPSATVMPYPLLAAWRMTRRSMSRSAASDSAKAPLPSLLPASTSTTSYCSASWGITAAMCGSSQRRFSDSLWQGSTRLIPESRRGSGAGTGRSRGAALTTASAGVPGSSPGDTTGSVDPSSAAMPTRPEPAPSRMASPVRAAHAGAAQPR